ncbi:GDNF-inducible zinc finger protein 1-like [Pararge aegeria]|uniref:GDNF-inducible zinc finger protein 1-like n=1 Tax=Pararge aegeria TaxID=116150 RepID=UPI0019D18E0F|nr:GDNF-inducible zinc finger protein 1-like [Pararge aegeria]
MTGAKINKKLKSENHCKYCKKTIIGNKYKFKAHLFRHNVIKERYNCGVCLKKFFRLDAYKVHLDRHNGTVAQKTYICDYCDRTFVNKNNLITHLKRIHDENIDSELGMFTCKICNLGYCERRLLEYHIRKVHFNIKFSKEPLHTNKLINETWLENVVNKNATVSITKVNNNVIVIKQLKIDVKVKHEKPNRMEYKQDGNDQYSKGVCDYCKKEMVKKSLRLHIKEVHMNIRRFKCDVCKETFSRNYQMVDHKCGSFKSYKKIKVMKAIKINS